MPKSSTSLALTATHPSSLPVAVNKSQAKIPAFLEKLYRMVDDSHTNDLIRWSEDGTSFYIVSAENLANTLLPRYFKHANFGSFVRQLNMYGFHKVPHLHEGVLKTDTEEANEPLEFANPNFRKGQPDLRYFIQRQKSKGDAAPLPSPTTQALDFPALLTDLAAIRKHQTALSSDLKGLQTSNNALWQEAIQSRDRATKQQDTINNILRFLATVFGGQFVGRDGGSSTSGVREEDGRSEGSRDGESEKGKEKEDERVRMGMGGRRQSRLLLEDVKGRSNNASTNESSTSGKSKGKGRDSMGGATIEEADEEIGGGGTDEEEIEEIPLNRDQIPTISRASQFPHLPTITRSSSQSGTNAFSFSPTKMDSITNSSSNPVGNSSSPSSSRFTTLPPTPVGQNLDEDQSSSSSNPYTLPPDYLASLLSNNASSQTLEAFLKLQNNGGNNGNGNGVGSNGVNGNGGGMGGGYSNSYDNVGTSSSGLNGMDFNFPPTHPSSTSDSHLALLPSPKLSHSSIPSTSQTTLSPSYPNPFASLYDPSSSTSLTDSNRFSDNLANQSDSLLDAHDATEDIHKRTEALEEAIAKLMNTLPAEAKEHVLNGNVKELGALTPEDWTGMGGESNWGIGGGGQGENEELDRFMAQFVNANADSTAPSPTPSSSSQYPLNTGTSTHWDLFPSHSALGVNPDPLHSGITENEDNDEDDDEDEDNDSSFDSPEPELEGDDEFVLGGGIGSGKGKGKAKGKGKRGSAVVEEPSVGTRRSTRRRLS